MEVELIHLWNNRGSTSILGHFPSLHPSDLVPPWVGQFAFTLKHRVLVLSKSNFQVQISCEVLESSLTTMKTNIVNKTKQSFELKEGNAGAYRFLKQLDPGAKVSIKVDPNATYREYVVATGKKGESIFLTSDDFSEYKVIDIEEAAGQEPGTVIYKSVPSNPRKPRLSKASEPSTVGGAGVGSDPPATPAAGVGSVPPITSAAAVGLDPPASTAAGAGSVPGVPAAAGARSDPRALSVASTTPPIGNLNQNERVSLYKKLKSLFK